MYQIKTLDAIEHHLTIADSQCGELKIKVERIDDYKLLVHTSKLGLVESDVFKFIIKTLKDNAPDCEFILNTITNHIQVLPADYLVIIKSV